MAIFISSYLHVYFSWLALLKLLLSAYILLIIYKNFRNFADIFSLNWAALFLKYTRIKNDAIKFINNFSSHYRYIETRVYRTENVENSIETNITTSFIRRLKFSIRTILFFEKKPNEKILLDINYQVSNNLIIKNQYLLLLINKLFGKN